MTTDDDEVDYYRAIISLSFQYEAVLTPNREYTG
jgi:hypothetical protein